MFRKLLIILSFLLLNSCKVWDYDASNILTNNNNFVTDNYLDLNLYGEDDFYITSWVWPPHAPYTNIFEITAVAWFICGCGVIFGIIGIILLATSRDINNETKVMIIQKDLNETTIDGVRAFAGYCTFCGTPFHNSKVNFCSNCGNTR